MPRHTDAVRAHLDKARESALLAVETYNRPGTKFRSGGYIVLMCIAWTALFHAIFFKSRIKPFYRKKTNRRHFDIVDGDKKAWELSTCVDRYWCDQRPPQRANLEFFIKLRNKIEHRSMPSLDIGIFGECQALLFNFEELIREQFGSRHALNESLSLALQFSRARHEQQDKAVKRLHRPLAKGIASYLEAFRSSLSAELLQDQRFSYKVFLIPKLANHQKSADLAVEFVKYDPSKPEEMARYDRLVSLIKPSAPAVADSGKTTATVAVRIVDEPDALAARAIDYDESHPNRQKDLIGRVNGGLPGGVAINSHDILAIRYAFNVDSQAKYFHKSKFGSPQYSDLFAEWIVRSYEKDQEFFRRAREKYQDRKVMVPAAPRRA
jgi:hypothetical protein